jgi:hypothetical protein
MRIVVIEVLSRIGRVRRDIKSIAGNSSDDLEPMGFRLVTAVARVERDPSWDAVTDSC